VLTLPGADGGTPAEHLERLNDLVVVVANGMPMLRGRQGHRYLPVFLGLAYFDYLPTFVKFVCAFGPTELGAVFPDGLVREMNGAIVRERTIIGNVVLQRRSWRVPVNDLRKALLVTGEADAYLSAQDWREAHNIPQRVFAIERIPSTSSSPLYKPQYLDLTSPAFMSVFRAIVQDSQDTILLQEVLPDPESYPPDPSGRRWAVELLVDSLSLQAVAGTIPV
jgi:hypothetical protein